MNYHNKIQFWAHMLDESFTDDFTVKLPADENEKFKFGEVFTADVYSKYDEFSIFNSVIFVPPKEDAPIVSTDAGITNFPLMPE